MSSRRPLQAGPRGQLVGFAGRFCPTIQRPYRYCEKGRLSHDHLCVYSGQTVPVGLMAPHLTLAVGGWGPNSFSISSHHYSTP